MSNTISWQQYFVAVLILLLLYYSYVLLRYFRPEISKLFNLNKAGIQSNVTRPPLTAVMGEAKPEPGLALVQADELMFSATDDEPELLEKTSSEELLSESLSLVEAFKDVDNKPEFLELLSLLVYKYQPFRQEIDLKVITARLKAKAEQYLPFAVNQSEWPLAWDAE